MAVAVTELKPLYEQRVAPNLIKVPLFYAIWIGLGAVAWKTSSTNTVLTWACYVAMGYMQMGIVTFMHECTHSIMFKAKWKNTAFGTFAMIPFLISYISFKEDHLVHHAYNRSPKDPDAVFYGRRKPLDFLLFYGYCIFGVPLSLIQFGGLYAVQALRGRKALQHWAEMAGHAVILYVVLTWARNHGILSQVLQVWLIPFLFFGLFNSARFVAEHYGTPYDVGQLAGARTVTSNAITCFFWNNINWHIGHHVYPAVPWYNLQKLHALMLPDIEKEKAHVASSYTAVFIDALLHGPESAETVAKRNPHWTPKNSATV